MFKGNSSISFKSTKSKVDIIKVVEEQLENMGNVSVSSSGVINITSSKFSGFGYQPIIEGKVSERDGRFSVNIDFQATPQLAAWLISICFFPIGLLVMLLPFNAKSDMQRVSDQALQEIQSIFDEK